MAEELNESVDVNQSDDAISILYTTELVQSRRDFNFHISTVTNFNVIWLATSDNLSEGNVIDSMDSEHEAEPIEHSNNEPVPMTSSSDTTQQSNPTTPKNDSNGSKETDSTNAVIDEGLRFESSSNNEETVDANIVQDSAVPYEHQEIVQTEDCSDVDSVCGRLQWSQWSISDLERNSVDSDDFGCRTSDGSSSSSTSSADDLSKTIEMQVDPVSPTDNGLSDEESSNIGDATNLTTGDEIDDEEEELVIGPSEDVLVGDDESSEHHPKQRDEPLSRMERKRKNAHSTDPTAIPEWRARLAEYCSDSTLSGSDSGSDDEDGQPSASSWRMQDNPPPHIVTVKIAGSLRKYSKKLGKKLKSKFSRKGTRLANIQKTSAGNFSVTTIRKRKDVSNNGVENIPEEAPL